MEVPPWHAEELNSARELVTAISNVRRVSIFIFMIGFVYIVLSEVELCDVEVWICWKLMTKALK